MRIVSRPTFGASFRFTASSAMSRTLHRALPSGARLHTMAMILWLWPASSTRCLTGDRRAGMSLTAVSKKYGISRAGVCRIVNLAQAEYHAAAANHLPLDLVKPVP